MSDAALQDLYIGTRRLKLAQQIEKRAMLEMLLRDRIRNEEMGRRTMVTKITKRNSSLKRLWTGHKPSTVNR